MAHLPPEPPPGSPQPAPVPPPAQPDADADDSLLEKVDNLVDELLAEGLTPDVEEDPWERRAQRLDSWTTVLLGLAALLTAWASFQAGQFGDVRTDAQSASAIQRNQAAVASSEASRDELIDSQLWLSWSDALNSGDDAQARFLESRFSPTLKAASADWLEDARLRKDGSIASAPPGSPMDLAEYKVPERARALQLMENSELLLAESDQAATTSNGFLFVVVLLALVLFMGSLVTKVRNPKLQVATLVITAALLAVSFVRVGMLPHEF